MGCEVSAHRKAMELSDRAEYGHGFTDEQRREFNARAAEYELRAVAQPDPRDPPRYAVVRSACWLLIDSGDPCKAARLARWASANGMRDYVRQALLAAEKLLEDRRDMIVSVKR